MAGLAIIGQAFLLLAVWLLPVFSEIRLMSDNVGELALGRFGSIQTLAFLVAGTTAIVFAFAIHETTSANRWSATGSLLIGIYGLCGVAAALFPSDRIDGPIEVSALSANGRIHLAAVSLGVLSVTLAMFVSSLAFSRDWRWMSATRWSVPVFASTLAILFAQAQGPLVGLTQRALVMTIAAWIILAAIHVWRLASRVETASMRSMARR
jgi:hypothetical protein